MITNSVVALIDNHSISKLTAIYMKSGRVYTKNAHDITILPALEVFAVVKTPVNSNELTYIDFDDVSSLSFESGEDTILESKGIAEGKHASEVVLYERVESADVGVNYVNTSVGEIKKTRTFKEGAVIGDPCYEKELFYATQNKYNLPTKAISRTSVVTADDIS